MTRRTVIRALAAAGGLVGVGLAGGYMLKSFSGVDRQGSTGDGMMSGGMMGSATTADMSSYRTLFNGHTDIRRTVEQIPGGVRTTTESDDPKLAALLKAHVSSMYEHVNQGAEVSCMSQSLPTLFRNSHGYRRQLSLTANGVVVTETSNDPELTRAIRKHAEEVTGFVRDGMPAMMQGMMGG